MEQYLFRAKRIDNGEWVEGCLVSTSPDEAFILIGVTGHIKRDDYECYMVAVVSETVGMWTGWNDKHGNKIFAGDALRGFQKDQKDKEGKNGSCITNYVHWRLGGFTVFGKSMQDGYGRENNVLFQFMWCNHGYHNTPTHYYQLDDIEVVGNIHDVNPTSGQAGNNYMFDPNLQAASPAEGQQQATEQVAATESEAQDQAMEVDSEEGGAQG